ncbi:MAG: hypothetical protein ABIB97_00365 [Patescibacteria group bacterium]
MRLSKLQKYILIQSLGRKPGRFGRNVLNRFYDKEKKKPSKKDIQNIITKSIERMIDKELLIGYGRRTPHMWFIDEIQLTGKGRREAKKLFGQQQALPFKKRKKLT